MVKSIKTALLAIIFSFNLAAFADNNDYESDYFEDEGRLLFKVRGSAISTKGKQTGLPAPINANAVSVGPFVRNGYGFDTAAAIFFNDNMAVEMSLGINVLKTKYSSLINIANNYNGTPPSKGKKKSVFMVPLSLTGQYHVAPFGAIRPYVGAGYHVAYFFTKAKQFKLKNGHGFVAQIGVDLVAKDDTIITFDIRQFFSSTRITYRSGLVGNTSVTSKAKINPLLFSVGVGFKL